MAKSKNHTNHNQNYKDHRNGIKQVPRNKYISTDGMNQKLLKNLRRARKFDPTIKKQKNLTAKIDVLRKNKSKILALIKAKIAKKMKKAPEKPAEKITEKAAAKKEDAGKAKGK